MKLNPVNKKSERPVHQQLREQIIARITTGDVQVGDEMDAVRDVARRLRIGVNTVSSVYRELVVEGWLVEQPGSHHIVIRRMRDDALKTKFEGPDELVDHTINLALKNGYPLQQVVSLLQMRLLDQPPDRLVIVEPEPGLGELMREEIRQKVGIVPLGCSVADLQQDASKSIGAVLLAPIHLQDLLDFVPQAKRNTVTLFFSSPDEYAARVRDLPQASAVGMISISPAALKTFRDSLADAIGERHTANAFLMEWPVGKSGPRFKDFSKYEKIYVRTGTPGNGQSENTRANTDADSPHRNDDHDQLRSTRDLSFLDILFCDSIAYEAMKHPRRVRCQLLSNESLMAVSAKFESLKRDLDVYGPASKAAAAKAAR